MQIPKSRFYRNVVRDRESYFLRDSRWAIMDAMMREVLDGTAPERPVTDAESDISAQPLTSDRPAEWLKMGAVAAASALLGGLAAAWYYRKTLARLRQAEGQTPETEPDHFDV
jgi:hypothetical protein